MQNVQQAIENDRKVYSSKLVFMDINSRKPIKWKAGTELCCRWDTYPFKGRPCCVPLRYNNHKFYGFGVFCSFSCALAYSNSLGGRGIWERKSLLFYFCRKLFNKDVKIIEALPIETLIKFGGELTIEEFRKNHIFFGKEYRVVIPPMAPIVALIEQDYNDKSKNMKNVNAAMVRASEFKLMRTTPLPKKSSLVKTMKLQIRSKS